MRLNPDLDHTPLAHRRREAIDNPGRSVSLAAIARAVMAVNAAQKRRAGM
jgi:hypothetical protein